MQSIFLLTISAMLFFLFVVGSVFNATSILMRLLRKKFPSVAVFIPGIAGVVALAICPYKICHKYVWLPLIVDPGCLLSVIIAFATNARDMYDTNRFFLTAQLQSYRDDDCRLKIYLFRSGRFTLNKIDQQSLLSGIGNWSFTNGKLILHIWSKRIVYDFATDEFGENSYPSSFHWSSDSTSSPIDGLNLRQIAGKRFELTS